MALNGVIIILDPSLVTVSKLPAYMSLAKQALLHEALSAILHEKKRGVHYVCAYGKVGQKITPQVERKKYSIA